MSKGFLHTCSNWNLLCPGSSIRANGNSFLPSRSLRQNPSGHLDPCLLLTTHVPSFSKYCCLSHPDSDHAAHLLGCLSDSGHHYFLPGFLQWLISHRGRPSPWLTCLFPTQQSIKAEVRADPSSARSPPTRGKAKFLQWPQGPIRTGPQASPHFSPFTL